MRNKKIVIILGAIVILVAAIITVTATNKSHDKLDDKYDAVKNVFIAHSTELKEMMRKIDLEYNEYSLIYYNSIEDTILASNNMESIEINDDNMRKVFSKLYEETGMLLPILRLDNCISIFTYKMADENGDYVGFTFTCSDINKLMEWDGMYEEFHDGWYSSSIMYDE